MLEQFVLEYGGYSSDRGRCHLILDLASSTALVGDPRDNPGTSVTNAIEQVAADIERVFGTHVGRGRLFEYSPWDPRRRRSWISKVDFRGNAWSMPTWVDADPSDPFVEAATKLVHDVRPYTLANLGHLPLKNTLVRVRIAAPYDLYEEISDIGTIEHISQRHFFYVDVEASSADDAVRGVRRALAGRIAPEQVQLTTPGAPLDQPGTIPI